MIFCVLQFNVDGPMNEDGTYVDSDGRLRDRDGNLIIKRNIIPGPVSSSRGISKSFVNKSELSPLLQRPTQEDYSAHHGNDEYGNSMYNPNNANSTSDPNYSREYQVISYVNICNLRNSCS